MASLPVIRSPEQILGDLYEGFRSRLPTVKVDLNSGSVTTQFFEAVKQSNFRSYAAVIQMVDALSVERAVGDALKRIARDNRVPILPALPAAGNVDITDQSFQRLASFVYAGQPAPVAGSLILYVANAEGWPTTGTVYVGRGTTNYEGPLQYTSLTPLANGSYWQVVLDSSSPTTKFHNIGETVVVGQGGNRTIPVNTLVQTAAGLTVTAVQYRTRSAAVILDGETTVTNVPVVATTPGPVGNAARGAIKQATGLSFPASVANQQPFTSGRDADTDDVLRERIKAYKQVLSKGTPLAIQLAAIDVEAQDELKRVVSSSVVESASGYAALVFDDGSGYEPIFSGIGIEQVVDDAVGGVRDLQLRNRAIVQAQAESGNDGPYDIPDLSSLSVTIAGVTTVHTFLASDFRVSSAALPIEVAASINGDATINFLANTSRGGTRVVIYPRDPKASDVKVNRVDGSDAGAIIGFSDVVEYSLRLYKNDQPLYQAGLFATIPTRDFPTWSATVLDGDTLQYEVDGTPEVTTTFTLQAFQRVDPTATPSTTTSIDIWSQVMSNLMPGVKTAVNGQAIELTSSRGQDDKASLRITGGTLRDKIFAVGVELIAQGRTSDYTFNLNTGQLSLAEILADGDRVSAGSAFTRGNVLTAEIPSGPAVAGRAWFVVDGAAEPVPNDLQASSQVRFSKTASSTRIVLEARSGDTLLPEGFGEALPGDWVLVFANSGDDPSLAANQGFWRVASCEVGRLEFDGAVAGSTSSTAWFSVPTDRITLVRSAAPMQRLEFDVSDLPTFATVVAAQLAGVSVDIAGSEVRITTLTAGDGGDIYVAQADVGGRALALPVGELRPNVPSQFGFAVTADSEAGFPNFNYTVVPSITDDETIQAPDYLDLGGDLEDFVSILDRYETSPLRPVPASDRDRRALVHDYDPVTADLTLVTPLYMKSGDSSVDPSFDADHPQVRPGDRYFLRTAYRFDSTDTLSVVIDGELQTKSYGASVARRLQVNTESTPTLQDFSADDLESSLPLDSPSSFEGFDFADFKAWRKAQAELTDGTYDLLVKSADFGPAGDRVRVGFLYPESPDQTELSAKITYGDAVDYGIVLPVTSVRTPNWDASTSFTTSVATTGGLDDVTYTWRAGTQPNFLTAGVTAGDVAILAFQLQFLEANSGLSAKVSSLTATSFTLQLPTGKVATDEIDFDSIDNTGGVVTLTKSTGHGVQAGQRFGLYNTAILTGSTRPYDSGDYVASAVTATTITTAAPAGVPGGPITSGTHSLNTVTIGAIAHGLFVGNVVKISGAGVPYDGLFAVSAIPNANTFQYVLNGSSASIASGRFDFQSVAPASSVAISTISRALNTNVVTVNTALAHGLSPTNLVSIQNVDIVNWAAGSYNFGDVVEDALNNQLYKAILAGASATNPSLDPARWVPTTLGLTGIFSVSAVITPTQFQYLYQDSTGATSGTGGTATLYEAQASLARAVGGAASLLSFAEVSTTQQEVVDFLSTTGAGQLEAAIAGGATTDLIELSTADLDQDVNYLSDNVLSIARTKGSRVIIAQVLPDIPAGSTITISTGATEYDGTYTVLRSVQNGPNRDLTLQSTVLASVTGTVPSSSGTFYGRHDYQMLQDGSNQILTSDVSAAPASPQFTLKRPWVTAPAPGEEVRLLAESTDHLTRFWNRLVVTGLANVAKVDNSQYGRQLQVTTLTAGSVGSVQVTGGDANAKVVAFQGSGSTERSGSFLIPYELRRGAPPGAWIKLQNTVRDNKQVPFSQTTFVTPLSNGLRVDTSEVLVNQRSTAADSTTVFRVEYHGPFLAFICVSGTSPDLSGGDVVEGDWVRIKNVIPQLYSGSTSYTTGNKVKDGAGNNYVALQPSVGQPLSNAAYWMVYLPWSDITTYAPNTYVSFAGRLWLALTSSTNVIPGTDPEVWSPTEFDTANNGIFRVVRVYGEDAFWIENPNGVEQVTRLGDPNDLSFFSYDSVMPGDTLVLSGAILGQQNVGRYTVLDDVADGSSFFPAPKRVYTEPLPAASGVSTLLGLSYNQVSFEEDEPIQSVKRIVGIGPAGSGQAAVLVDSPELMDRYSSSNGAYMQVSGKLGFPTTVSYGLDGYKRYLGLILELNRVIYGDPVSTTVYPGVRAAGTDVGIAASLIKRVRVGLAIRTKTGISFDQVTERVQAAVAGYVNQLGAGEPVVLSEVISSAQSVNGVVSVIMTFPTFSATSDVIAVGRSERAKIIDPTGDVVVSILGT